MMKKILLLLAVCTVTTANAARPFTIMNETDNYIIYGPITAKDTSNCSGYIDVYGVEFLPGDNFEFSNQETTLGLLVATFDNAEVIVNGVPLTRNFPSTTRNLLVNGTYEWSNFNFKAYHQTNFFADGENIKFFEEQECNNNLSYQWTGGNGTSIARAEPYTIGGHTYMTFTEQ